MIHFRHRYSLETIVEYCLQALLSHSTVESHCNTMLRTPMLPLFVRIVNEFPCNAKIKSVIGKILANMSLFPGEKFYLRLIPFRYQVNSFLGA